MTTLLCNMKLKTAYVIVLLVCLIILPSAAFAESCPEPESVDCNYESGTYEDEGCCQESALLHESVSFSESTDPEKQAQLDSDPLEGEPPDHTASDQDADDPDISACATSQDSLVPSSELPETEECLLSTCASSLDDPDRGVESGEDYSSESTAASGNSYTATISPDAVVNEGTIPVGYDGLQAGDPGQFTVTFTEHSDSTKLGSAKVEIPDGFTDVSFNNDWSSSGIETSGDQEWQGKLEVNITDGYIIYLRALNPSSYLGKDEWVSVMFGATSPSNNGAYVFGTAAWTDDSLEDSSELDSESLPINQNNMATGYRNPVVIVGTGIGSVEDLEMIGTDSGYPLSGHYVQTTDIDFKSKYSEIADWNSGAGWYPIGDNWGPNFCFRGSYNGNGYQIKNLTVNRDGSSSMGFIGHTGAEARLLNISLISVEISGHKYVGGLVGWNYGHISNCSVSGRVEGLFNLDDNSLASSTGGLVGINFGTGTVIECHVDTNTFGFDSIGGLVGQNRGIITGSSATGSVKGRQFIGGLVGYNSNTGMIINCQASTAVTLIEHETRMHAGGLVGYNESLGDSSGLIENCDASGLVVGHNQVGGLVGTNQGRIIDCYTTGSVEGNNYVGGLVGRLDSGEITNCYSTGSISGSGNHIGGLVGYNNGRTILNCFATGDVHGDYNIGGLVGSNDRYSYIIASYATGDVNGTGSLIGGLVGWSLGASIIDCYAKGSVQGTLNSSGLGGLVGSAQEGLILRCYSAGLVHAGNTSGGLLGGIYLCSITDCYYDSQTSGHDDDNGRGEPKTTAELQSINTFNGWDISPIVSFDPEMPTTWFIIEGQSYPLLWWQYGDILVDDPGDDNGEGPGDNGDEPGDLDDFDWYEGMPADQSWPGGGNPAWSRILVFRGASGPPSVFSADMVINGTASDLRRAMLAYERYLGQFEQNRENMTDDEFAVAVIELATARAAIMALEARLSGDPDAMQSAAAAYQFALAQLAVYDGYLDSSQLEAVNSILDAVSSILQ